MWAVGVSGKPASDGSRRSASETWAWSWTPSDSRLRLKSNSFTTRPMMTSRPSTTTTTAMAVLPLSAAGGGAGGDIAGLGAVWAHARALVAQHVAAASADVNIPVRVEFMAHPQGVGNEQAWCRGPRGR